MLKYRLSSLSARKSNRGGFTLIELLVVIAIIGVLASVTVPAVMGGLAKAKQNVGMQNARSIGLLMFQFAIDNDGAFPPTSSATAPTSTGAFMQILAGKYATSADIFWLSGEAGKPTSYNGAAAASTGLAAQYVTWSVMGETPAGGGTTSGVTQSDPDQLPLVFTEGNALTIPAAGANGPGQATTGAANPFKNQGIPVCYHGNNAKFMNVDAGDNIITKFIPASYVGPAGVTYAPLNP